MARIIKLTESDLQTLVKRIMIEEKKMKKGHQGYKDKEDEKLAMKHGKIANKDLKSTKSRRDDARFEKRETKEEKLITPTKNSKGKGMNLKPKRFEYKESFWNSIFGKPTVDDAAHGAEKSQGFSHKGRGVPDMETQLEDNYIMFNGKKFYPDQIEYADYQDLGDLPRVENGKLIIANPAWSY